MADEPPEQRARVTQPDEGQGQRPLGDRNGGTVGGVHDGDAATGRGRHVDAVGEPVSFELADEAQSRRRDDGLGDPGRPVAHDQGVQLPGELEQRGFVAGIREVTDVEGTVHELTDVS